MQVSKEKEMHLINNLHPFTWDEVEVAESLAFSSEVDFVVIHFLIAALNFVQVCSAGCVFDSEGSYLK